MNNVSMNAHGIKEIRILRGQDDLDHLLRIIVVSDNDKLTDFNFFGMSDKGEDIIIPIKIDCRTARSVSFDSEFNFIGDEIEEEE